MQPIIYDVAVSADSFISGPDEDISKFAHDGPVVDDYAARLATYRVAIMGRRTYEFGYRFGLKPGQNPYPHMRCLVVSETVALPANAEVTAIRGAALAEMRRLREAAEGPIYLCGGGVFAGALLAAGLIDQLCLKRAPVLLGEGVRLFGDAGLSVELSVDETKLYDGGYLYQAFRVG